MIALNRWNARDSELQSILQKKKFVLLSDSSFTLWSNIEFIALISIILFVINKEKGK